MTTLWCVAKSPTPYLRPWIVIPEYPYRLVYLFIHSPMVLQLFCCNLAIVLRSVILYTGGRTPWTGDQPVARPLLLHRTTQTQNKHSHKHPWNTVTNIRALSGIRTYDPSVRGGEESSCLIYLSVYDRHSIYLPIYLSIYGSTVLLLDLGRFFSFLILFTVGRTPWTGDQPVAKWLPTHRTTNTE
jgi:hypothetical protein